jgi:hypothetical protein
LQRTCEIWAFAFSFAWRYFLLNQKWTYPKKQGGMTPAAVSARKSELAGAAAAQYCLFVGFGLKCGMFNGGFACWQAVPAAAAAAAAAVSARKSELAGAATALFCLLIVTNRCGFTFGM